MNKPMFWIGVVLAVTSAILLAGNFMADSASSIVLGIIGIVFMGASNYRPLERKKKK